MMADFERYINEAIKLELNVSDLYLLFYRLFPEDSFFWWMMAVEEKNHAALLKNLKKAYSIMHEVPCNLNYERIQDLEAVNQEISEILITIKENPSRKKAFEYAILLEESAGESHFQIFTENHSDPDHFDIFRQLNMDDKNHAERIQKYMDNHLRGIRSQA